ncbi:TonB-dependent receptor [Yeosuana aromativorans]|uniref:TonB-dependent receptor n=1 Tax=Yeosuana aromativorans TaxID=288019 RepID=A0A8J3FJ99_9FLAO|nr:TonB-dependent receptor [Yeosuana aromativorans]GGK32837.1 TonB-dependent receptor [Yeosuana aromativorans]
MRYTKAHTISLLLVLNVFFTYAQIKGKIIDSENKAPIADVEILNTNNDIISKSNAFGEFDLPDMGTYEFKKSGFQDKKVTIKKTGYLVIQLNINVSQLNEIIVSANHIPQRLKKATSSIDVITSNDIQRINNVNLTEVLNKVPGVYMQTGSLNTNKISIRGIGSRNLYGTSKIRAYFEDIPLTTGNGETTIEDFELGAISRFEIIKGAASSIYGAGLGGTIHLMPKNAFLNQKYIKTELSLGSFGLTKEIVNFNYGTENNSFRAVYSNTKSDGYRDNNAYNRQTFTINTNHYLNETNSLSFLVSYVDLKSYIPSSVDENTYRNNPTAAAYTWAQSKGYEDSQRGIFGSTWDHQFNEHAKVITSIFSSFKKSYEPRPFDILSENTFALGLRSRLLGTDTLFGKELNWTLGTEFFKDRYIYGTFENLYQDYPQGTGSVEGDRLSNFKENRTYYNAFFETNYNITKSTTLSVGLNYNRTLYKLKDRFVTQDNPDQSGSYGFKGILSPKFGVSHELSKNISLFSNISHGFSPPTTSETLLPDGMINTNIKPETGWNYEIGTRTALYNSRLKIQVSLYRLAIKNLLVARRTGNDQFIGVNAGKTRHDGMELSLKYQWLTSKTFSLNHYLTYSLNHYRFKDFVDGDNNYSGNKLTGVPSNILNTGIDINSQSGIYGTINFEHVGKMPITDSNSIFNDAYNLTNLKLGYRTSIKKTFLVNVYFGLDNVFDEHYASQILINARGFNGAAPRYYYPGSPINFYLGININFLF